MKYVNLGTPHHRLDRHLFRPASRPSRADQGKPAVFDILVQKGKVRYIGAKIKNRRIESYHLEISLHALEAQTGRLEKNLP